MKLSRYTSGVARMALTLDDRIAIEDASPREGVVTVWREGGSRRWHVAVGLTHAAGTRTYSGRPLEKLSGLLAHALTSEASRGG